MSFARGVLAALGAALIATVGAAAETSGSIPVGHLTAITGPTSAVAKIYGQGIDDAMAYINQSGGINGKKVNFQTVDYGYDAERAVATYKEWSEKLKPVAIQGWGTADTEALVGYVNKDQIVFMSGSSSGHLTDPTGKSPYTNTPAPYNFFYGPSYSDGCRGLVQWAAEDWKRVGRGDRSTFLGDLYRPKFVYMGDNHPYPNAPKAACIEYARDLGFEVLAPIRYSLTPGDFTPQCQQLKQTGANYVFLGNTSESNIALVKSCLETGVSSQFMTNIYGWDENAAKEAGNAGNGVVWVVSAATWNENVPGMDLVRKVSKMSGGESYRPVHYMRGVCSAFFMHDAMANAEKIGGINGPNIKKGFEQMRDHVPQGLDGVCLPSTWTADDHRGTTTVMVYRSVNNYGNISAEKIYTTRIPLRPDWLGW